MQVSVRFFTSLREIVNKKEETLKFAENQKVTVDLTLKTLSKQYGKSFVDYVFNDATGNVKNFLQLLVNGNSVTAGEGLRTELHDGDVLAILPPVGGG